MKLATTRTGKPRMRSAHHGTEDRCVVDIAASQRGDRHRRAHADDLRLEPLIAKKPFPGGDAGHHERNVEIGHCDADLVRAARLLLTKGRQQGGQDTPKQLVHESIIPWSCEIAPPLPESIGRWRRIGAATADIAAERFGDLLAGGIGNF